VKKVFHIKDEKEKAEALTKFLAEDLPKHAGSVEKLVGLYGKNGYAVGDALTWADLYIFDYFSGYTDKVPDFKTNYPQISKIVEAIRQHPKIAEYLEKRPVTEF
jgi:glutathione S-transferase